MVNQRHLMVVPILLCLLLACTRQLFAQNSASFLFNFDHQELALAMQEVSEVTSAEVIFSPEQLAHFSVDGIYQGTVSEIMDQLLVETDLEYKMLAGTYILFQTEFPPYLVSGYVQDAATGERLPEAHVYDLRSLRGVSTNEYGFYSISVSAQEAVLGVSYTGFTTDTQTFSRKSPFKVINLDKSLTLDEVVVYGTVEYFTEAQTLDIQRLTPGQPGAESSLGGEFDLQQSTMHLSGITTGADGIGGINVRGGSHDQNLVLLDGVSLYSPSHAAGILSVVNPLLIREATVTKGPMSAKHSGRLSSVTNVITREGNMNKWSVAGSLGTLTSGVMVEGPLVKDKVSILMAGRLFVPGAYVRSISERHKLDLRLNGETDYFFGDLNVKLNAVISQKDRLYFGLYVGKDYYTDHTIQNTVVDAGRLRETFDKRLGWGNKTATLRWNRAFGSKTFGNLTFSVTDYSLESLDDYSFLYSVSRRTRFSGFDQRKFSSSIRDFTAKWDLEHRASDRHYLRAGIGATVYHFKPKSITLNDQSQFNIYIIDESTFEDALFSDLFVTTYEMYGYVEDNITISENTSLIAGLHLGSFTNGSETYIIPQPRIRIDFNRQKLLKFNVSAGRSAQNVHLLTTSGIGLPTDLWVPSSEAVKPQTAWQFTVGTSLSYRKNWTFAWQLYYKHMQNLTYFREGASFLFQGGSVEAGLIDAADWEQKVVQGQGMSAGSEWMAGYRSDRLHVSASYALSKSVRHVEEFNDGRSYDFRYDRPHNLHTNISYELPSGWSFTAGWTYASGNPITLAESKHLTPANGFLSNVTILNYGSRNGYRLPAYHRLDLGASYEWTGKKFTHGLYFSLYNAYNHANTLYFTVESNETRQSFAASEYTVLPIIPSFRYTIRL